MRLHYVRFPDRTMDYYHAALGTLRDMGGGSPFLAGGGQITFGDDAKYALELAPEDKPGAIRGHRMAFGDEWFTITSF